MEGSKNVSFNLGNGVRIPNKIIAGIVPADSYHGSIEFSPTWFSRYNLTKYDIQVDNKVLPYFPIKCSANLQVRTQCF